MSLRTRLDAFLAPTAADTGLVAQAPPVAAMAIARRFWPLLRPYRGRMFLGLLCLIAVPALDTLEIYLFKLVVDDVLVPQELAALLPLALAYLGLALLGGVLNFFDEYLATWVGERFLLDLRAQVFGHVSRLDPDALARHRSGDILSRITSDVGAIERFLLSGIGEGVSSVARIVFFLIACLLLSWKLTLAALVVVPLFFFASRRFGTLVRHAAREKRRRSGSLSAVAEETLSLAPLTQSLNREESEVKRFRDENAAIMDAEMASTRIAALFGPLVGLIELVGGMLVLAFGVWALSSGDLTLGGLLVFITYLAQLYSPVRSLGQLSQDLFAAAAGAERVIELLDERPTVADAPDARPLPTPVRGHVELCDVTHRHPGAERAALTGVSLAVRPGEIVAVTGASGAGKSTLARLLVRFADPEAGRVLIDGHDVRGATLASVREAVGLLLQDTLMPDVTAGEVIAQGRAGATRAEVEAAARAAGIHDVLVARPEGYDERVGPGGRRLSGGQRRRLAIARAFLRDAPLLVLDEPTTGLDADARDALLEPLQTLMTGRTTLVITHDPVVVGWADRVLELRDGVVVAPAAEAAPA